MNWAEGASDKVQSLCLVNFFFMSGANSPMLLVTTPTHAWVITL
jgi:hypothetical protein